MGEFKWLKAHDFTELRRTANVVDAGRILAPEKFRDVHLVAIGDEEELERLPF